MKQLAGLRRGEITVRDASGIDFARRTRRFAGDVAGPPSAILSAGRVGRNAVGRRIVSARRLGLRRLDESVSDLRAEPQFRRAARWRLGETRELWPSTLPLVAREHAHRKPPQHWRSLRPRQRFLSLVARRHDGVFQRHLSRTWSFTARGVGRKVRPRLPQARSCGRRTKFWKSAPAGVALRSTRRRITAAT